MFPLSLGYRAWCVSHDSFLSQRCQTRPGMLGLSDRAFSHNSSTSDNWLRSSALLDGGSAHSSSMRCFTFASLAPANLCFSASEAEFKNVCKAVRAAATKLIAPAAIRTHAPDSTFSSENTAAPTAVVNMTVATPRKTCRLSMIRAAS